MDIAETIHVAAQAHNVTLIAIRTAFDMFERVVVIRYAPQCQAFEIEVLAELGELIKVRFE